jgi:hypothetical protein
VKKKEMKKEKKGMSMMGMKKGEKASSKKEMMKKGCK